jgi:hypothetical protein
LYSFEKKIIFLNLSVRLLRHISDYGFIYYTERSSNMPYATQDKIQPCEKQDNYLRLSLLIQLLISHMTVATNQID